MRGAFRPVLVICAVLLSTCTWEPAVPEAEVDPDYRASIEEWRANRAKGLTRETGWLTLTGLFWLEEGDNSLGSAPDAAVRLPEGKALPAAGTLVMREGAVTLVSAPESGLLVDGQPVTSVPLQPDVSGDPTIVESGSVQFYVIERGDRVGVRVRDREHPARTSFAGLDYFPIDPSWRVEARLEPYDPPRQIPILNIIGIVEPLPSPGALVFEHGGKEYRLDPILEEGSDELFVIFADQTSGRETYPAGRYLYAAMPDPGGTTVLDFNKAYNPPCAFTEFATCPLPPNQNRLDARIDAGELAYHAE